MTILLKSGGFQQQRVDFVVASAPVVADGLDVAAVGDDTVVNCLMPSSWFIEIPLKALRVC